MRFASAGLMSVLKPPQRLAVSRPGHVSVAAAIFWILRVSAAMNFIFHGFWGVLGRESWLRFFAFAGIGEEAAYPLMALIGAVEIAAGLVVLFMPVRFMPARAALLFMVIWGLWTAELRPLTGSPWWYFLESAGYYGPPLALLLWVGWGNSIKDWFRGVAAPALTQDKVEIIKWTLRLSIGAYLITHGAYGAIEGKLFLIGHFASVGLPGPLTDPETFLFATGVFEMALGALVLISPMRPILVFVLVWKVFTELLFVTSGLPAIEHAQAFHMLSTLERFGMFGAPAGLFILMAYRANPDRAETSPAFSGATAVSGR